MSVPEEQKAPAESVSAAPAAGARGLQVSHCCLVLPGQHRAGNPFALVCLQASAGVVSCRKGVPRGAACASHECSEQLRAPCPA